MEIQLTPDQRAFAQYAIAAGRLRHEGDVVQQALSLWEERERVRMHLLTTLDAAEASLSRGAGRVITEESMQEVAEGVKARGRAQLASEQAVAR